MKKIILALIAIVVYVGVNAGTASVAKVDSATQTRLAAIDAATR